MGTRGVGDRGWSEMGQNGEDKKSSGLCREFDEILNGMAGGVYGHRVRDTRR